MILAILMLPIKFQDNRPFVSGEKVKTDFQDGSNGSHLGFPIGTILNNFFLQVTRMLLTKFHVNWPLFLEKKLKIDFQDCGHLGFPIE